MYMNKKENVIKKIFFDENKHWERFVKIHAKNIRKEVREEIEKFRLCGEKESGFNLFACDYCGDIKIVPHRCKGRFCNVCATGFMHVWSEKVAKNMYDIQRRHIMFTLPQELWEIFIRRRDLLKDLMYISVELLQDWFREKEKVEIGAMVGIHTFGVGYEEYGQNGVQRVAGSSPCGLGLGFEPGMGCEYSCFGPGEGWSGPSCAHIL